MTKRINKRNRSEFQNASIPVLTKHSTNEEFEKAFDTYKVIHLPLFLQQNIDKKPVDGGESCGENEPNANKDKMTWKDLKDVFAKLIDKDKKSWCIENNGKQDKGKSPENNKKDDYTKALDFLDPLQKSKDGNDCAYCSFLIQHDNRVKQEALSRFPISTLPFANQWAYGPSIWVFFGRNHLGAEDMQGRPEHTDSVSHDGTWHYQLSGTKRWCLRPTKKLVDHMKEKGVTDHLTESDIIEVDCKAGDVLIVNTAHWWHQTKIPPQPDPSVSYARDFYLDESKMDPEDNGEQDGGMTNVDGMYASNDVEAGTIIFTEHGRFDCDNTCSSAVPSH